MSGRRISSPIRSLRDPRSAPTCSRRWPTAGTARSARTITRGKHRRAIRLTSIATRTRSRCRCRQFDDQLASLTTGHRRSGWRPATLVPIRPVRVLGRARVVARTAGLRSRVERGAAALRSAQGGSGLRGRAARAVLPACTMTRPDRAPARCSSCRSRRRSTAACRRGSNGATGGAVAVHDEAPDAAGAHRARSLAASVVQLG